MADAPFWLAGAVFMAIPVSSFIWQRHKRIKQERTQQRLALIDLRQQNLDLKARLKHQ